MKVKSWFFFILGLVLIVPVVWFVIDRTNFVMQKQETTGEVQRITSKNSRCGGRRSKYDCTQFRADVRYEVSGQTYLIDVTAGSVRGHDRPKSDANYRAGSPVPVAYHPRDPQEAYRDTFWDIWGLPVGMFFFQVCSFIAGFSEKRRSSW